MLSFDDYPPNSMPSKMVPGGALSLPPNAVARGLDSLAYPRSNLKGPASKADCEVQVK